jgi:cystathionine beta-lyase/cystathionine gamma-synthase
MRVIDLRRMAALVHARGALLCVDNIAMSPYLQNPLDLGRISFYTRQLNSYADTTT